MKSLILITPSLKLRDGVSAHSMNLIQGWNNQDISVYVFNPTFFGVKYQGYFSKTGLSRELDFRSLNLNQIDVSAPIYVQYLISAYWLNTWSIHRLLKCQFGTRRIILGVHELRREIKILGKFGEKIYRHALARSNRVVVFSSSAKKDLSSLTESKILEVSLGVPKTNW